MEKPFNEGDTVVVKGNEHLGIHRVDECEWFTQTNPGVDPYWLCQCTEIRDLIDWSKIPKGATGIVTSSRWSGSAEHLIHHNVSNNQRNQEHE